MINGFTLHDASTAPAESAEILNGVKQAWGFVPNLHRVLAESPAALEAYSTLWIVRVTSPISTVERRPLVGSQRQSPTEPFRQVRVRDEMTAEGHEVRMSGGQGRFC
jgi:hypothetical protein